MKKLRLVGSVFLVSAGMTAGATTIDFEQYADGTQITNQYSGVTFSNALEATTTISLDGVTFPPHSGTGVITNSAPAGTNDPLFGQPNDPNAMLGINFAQSQMNISFYYTAQAEITVNLFDSSDDLVGSVLAASDIAFPDGIATGTSDLLNISSQNGFSSLLITDGSGIQNGFVIDDLTFATTGGTTGGGNPGGGTGGGGGNPGSGGNPGGGNPGSGSTPGVVPEPASLALMSSGMSGVLEMIRRRTRLGRRA